MRYECLGFWGRVVQTAFLRVGSPFVREFVARVDLTTPEGVKLACDQGIALLQAGEVPPEDASDIWQVSQCLKKFRYGGQVDESAMFQSWLERNQMCRDQRLPLSVEMKMHELLAPLGPAWDCVDGVGRFGPRAVYENYTSIAKWNSMYRAQRVNPYDPLSIEPQSVGLPPYTAALLCVPKDMFKKRVISKEPSEASFQQQYIRDRLLKAAEIALPRSSAIPQQAHGGGPEVQQDRCLLASSKGRLATIDLSAASDSISLDTVTRVFPTQIAAALERARSEYMELKAGTRVRVHMYAGMGNGSTFIVESLYFWALFTALSELIGIKTPVSVFGDDVILDQRVPTNAWVREQLVRAGITVNQEKSGLSAGPGFREACGAVAYCGCSCELLRIQGYRAENPVERQALCQLLNDMCASTSPSLRVMSSVIGGLLHRELHVPYVPVRLDTDGLYLVRSRAVAVTRSRWNTSLQRREWKVSVAESVQGQIDCGPTLTPAEADGVLRGQIHPVLVRGHHVFKIANTGYDARDGVAPCKLRTRWCGVWREPIPLALARDLTGVLPGCI